MSDRVQTHQARFESDPLGLEATKIFLEGEGYRDLRLIKSQRRHHVFQGMDQEGHKRFLKAATEPSELVFLENEVRADDFLRPLTEGLPIHIPEGEYRKFKSSAVADYEFVEGESLATESEFLLPYSDDELEALFQFQLRKHVLKERDIPEFFLKRAAAEFSDTKMVEKLEHTYLAPAIGPVLTEDEAQRIKQLFVETGFPREFAHHDFIPWNMLREADGRLAITDPEHARWGMKWYDLAYQYLQTHILLDAPDEAKRALSFFVRRFKEELPDEEIENELVHPFAYWTGACAFMAKNSPEMKSRVREVLPSVLAKDVFGLLE